MKAILRVLPALLALTACGGGSTSNAPTTGTTPIVTIPAPGTTAPVNPSTPVTNPTTPGAETTPPATEPSTPGTEPTTPTPPANETTPAEPPVTPPVVVPARWIPSVTDTWQWQLTGTLDTSHAVNVYDIDLFDTPQTTIDALKARGIRVVCYFSGGSSENWRADFKKFAQADMGNNLDGWAGERWLDTRSSNVRTIMKARLDLAREKGCDGVEPDNVDGYTNKPGFALTAATQLDYNLFLATEAHARDLSIGLKNDIDQLAQLSPHFDFAVNEQCHEYEECSGYTAFTSQGKPVFNAEYAARYRNNTGGARDALCRDSATLNIRTLVLPLKLDGSFRYSCSQ